MTDQDENWKAAHKRMTEGVEALLCFDLGLVGPELFGARSYVLDRVVRPEFEKLMNLNSVVSWRVMTIDANLTHKVVQNGLTERGASELLGKLVEEMGHGKHWCEREY